MSSVLTYRNNQNGTFCQIRFDSGERALISIAGKPTPVGAIYRLIFFGILPIKVIWKFTSDKAGGVDAFVHAIFEMFPPDPNGSVHPLDVIRDALLQCSSLAEAYTMLAERESRVSAAQSK